MPNDNEMVNLIKGAAKEGQFDKMSIEEMENIYHYGFKLAQDRPYDEELIKAINQFKVEIEKSNSDKSPQPLIRISSNISLMQIFFRVLILCVVVPATYYFLYWVPFSFIPFYEYMWVPIIISMLCAACVGWYVWRKLGARQYSLMSDVSLGALVIGGSGFLSGFIGPIIFTPEANQGPLLGIFITGPAGLIIGAILGFVIGKIRNSGKSEELSHFSSHVLKMWTLVLWVCGILSVTLIAAAMIYLPWRESKYSSIIESFSDLQKRDKTLKSLRVRSLSDDELVQLKQFADLNYLDFRSGCGVEDAKLTDSGLKNISELHLPKLEMLKLGYCKKITDDGMYYVAVIKNIKYLSLAGCSQITDGGLSKLTASSTIETLDLRGCKNITDRGLGYLKQMPKLKEVLLGGCNNITQTGIEELRRALPNSKIEKDDREWEMGQCIKN